MYHLNPAARHQGRQPYRAEDYADLSAFSSRHPELGPTPLRPLPCFARALGIGGLFVKDESSRFGLNAFKSLGVRYAMDRLQREHRLPDAATLACASAGNHGRAVARVARQRGLAATVLVPKGTARARIDAIEGEGARVEVVNGSYDDAVRLSAQLAGERRLVLSDTSWPGYE
ncbi:MAG: pyridoxal-phosphate dependent enzyme, partial [Vicinamibacterales bacterium]